MKVITFISRIIHIDHWQECEPDNSNSRRSHVLIPLNNSLRNLAKLCVLVNSIELSPFSRPPLCSRYMKPPDGRFFHCVVHMWLDVLQRPLFNITK